MKHLDKFWRVTSQFLGPCSLIIALIFGFQQYQRAEKAERRVNTVTKFVTSKTDYEEIIDDSSSTIVFKSKQLDREEFVNSRVDSLESIIDSIIAPYRDRIHQLTVVNTTLSTRLKGTKSKDSPNEVVYKDSTIQWKFDYATDSLDIDINLIPSYLTYSDNKSLLGFNIGNPTIYNKIWFNDSRIKFNDLNHIYIKPDIPRRFIKAYVGSEYRFGSNDLLVGPELILNVDNWAFNGKYLYNITSEKKEPVVGVKFNLLK